jgi:hypothetical protein
MIKFFMRLVWRTFRDERMCKSCGALDGREYVEDVFSSVLVDPQFGPIWDLNRDISLMHGASGTCRCRLEAYLEKVEIDMTDVKELSNLVESLK